MSRRYQWLFFIRGSKEGSLHLASIDRLGLATRRKKQIIIDNINVISK
jgi:hypothetical protein